MFQEPAAKTITVVPGERQKAKQGLEPAQINTYIMSNAAREILVSITAIIESLEHKLSCGDKKEKKELEIIIKNTRRLMELNNRLLERSQVENGKAGREKFAIYIGLLEDVQESNLCFQGKKKAEKAGKEKLNGEFNKELNDVMEKNYSNPDFNVEQLTKKLDISPSSLYRRIYDLTGQSPCEFMRSFRLKRAVQLFKRNFGSISDVAFEVGFNSLSYFCKCFKEKFKQLPSAYLNRGAVVT